VRFLVALLLVVFLSACKTTRFVPKNDYLLSKVEIEMENEQIKKDELKMQIRQKENLSILGFLKFHLWLYNLSSKNKETGWLKRIGEPPVIFDQALTHKSVQQMTQYLNNKGFYQADVEDSVVVKKRKARVVYTVSPGDPYMIRSVAYQIKDKQLTEIINSSREQSLVKAGNILDMDVLQQERSRITRLLRNDGFFRFSDEYIHFRIDTTLYERQANVELIVEPADDMAEGEYISHKRYSVSGYSVFVDQPQRPGAGNITNYSDTSIVDGFSFYHNGKAPLKKSLFLRSVEIYPGEQYSKQLEDRTYNNLYALRQFKYVNVHYTLIDEGDSLSGLLHGNIFVPLQVKQNYSFDIEGTNTSGNLGIAGNVNYQHRNLLRGAEIFDITLKGATERMVAMIDNENKEFNTREFGGLTKLTIPGFLFPLKDKYFSLHTMPFTSFSVSYNYQDRPDYTRTLVNATLGYQWKTSALHSHSFNILDLNAVRIFSLNESFINQIKDLYIKSSYTDHIISAANYTFIFTNQGVGRSPDYHFFRMNMEASGNALWGLSHLLNREKHLPDDEEMMDQSPFYRFFETRYAQYVKADFDYRYGYRFDKYNWIATRVFAGAALPYGNFNVMPFERRYYTGGANGIRAWHVRSLGPGSYTARPNEYPNQSADVKLEANFEYRFKLFWVFEGALFVDAGNIWAINRFDNREGAIFDFNSFYREFAVGSGAGLRFVSPYFIVRVDLGVKMRDPSLPHGERWIPQSRSYNMNDFNFNIGIGYPF
jgi:outer membrane protein assembly factor BamA